MGGLRGDGCADSQGPKIKASARSKADETRMDGVYDDVVGGRVQKNRDKQTDQNCSCRGELTLAILM